MTEQIFDIAINDKLTLNQLKFIFRRFGSREIYKNIASILSDIKNGKTTFIFERTNNFIDYDNFEGYRYRVNKFTLKTSLLLSRTLSNVTHLDLILTNPIPDTIGEFTSLEELNIILLSNMKNYLPTTIEKLSKLTSLKITSHDYYAKERLKIPTIIAKLTSLKKLQIIGIYNLVSRIPQISLRTSLNEKDSESLPEAFSNLVNLTNLKLKSVNLVSASFEKLVNLRRLSIVDTALTSLTGLENLVNLICLDITNSNLGKIPENLYNLTTLEILTLSDCKINELSEDMSNLVNLKFLHIQRNNLEKLPENLCNLTKLVDLSFNNNKLEKLPMNIKHLVNLKYLRIKHNPLKECNLDLKSFPKLSENDLNKLCKFVNQFKKLTLVLYKAFSFEHCAICLETVNEGILADLRESMDLNIRECLARNKPYTHSNNQIPHNDFIHAKCWKGLEYCPICRQK